MGEARRKREKQVNPGVTAALETAGGRVHVRWESASASTPMGQLVYFIEYLTLTGLWSRWIESCPLRYTSPNAPTGTDESSLSQS